MEEWYTDIFISFSVSLKNIKKNPPYMIKLSIMNMKFQENSPSAVPSAATWCCSLNMHYAAEGDT